MTKSKIFKPLVMVVLALAMFWHIPGAAPVVFAKAKTVKEVKPKATSTTTKNTKTKTKKTTKKGYVITTAVTTTTKTTTLTKPEKLKKAAKKTYLSKEKNQKKTSTKKNGKNKTKKTVTETRTRYQYTKKSVYRVKITKKVVTTTVTTTTKSKKEKPVTKPVTSVKPEEPKAPYTCGLPANVKQKTGMVAVAFQTLGQKVTINPQVSFAGLYSGQAQMITLKKESYMQDNIGTVYHELGHFLACIAGNADRSSEFKQIYAAEKGNYQKYNRVYVTSSCYEFFAEAYKWYVLDPEYVKNNLPRTYAAVDAAVKKITPEHIQQAKQVFSCVWTY